MVKPSDRLHIKRIYEAPAGGDHTRVLVDRLWPRGVSKQRAAVALWLKEIAPTDALRKWFGHDPSRWDEFRIRYSAELDQNHDEVNRLRHLIQDGSVTLLYAAKDEAHNNAVVLMEYLLSKHDH
jgi:uncharacterized protein YeaO (DUF488 family)